MTIIATHPCVEIRQEIGWTEKRVVEDWYELELYQDKLSYKNKEFCLSKVFDLSYRRTSNSIGFLYLHTDHGVHSLYIKSEPVQFIESFRLLKKGY
ncbi:hypothetical protein [Bacillus sp. FJAT-45350]|uniref:hypothetical protein n=1 Tax=Bacillus sp. FJAT-45350 TaxID=2011014 RepID=UPI000BB73A6C|nr:hypothetical protein [Bacillus sp. FJAT-45350]